MEERIWTRPAGCEMQFAVRSTSRERHWSGFEATIYDTSGGFSRTSAFANHSVSMHLGTPIKATCRCDGPIHHRFQIPGDVDVIPAGLGGRLGRRWSDHNFVDYPKPRAAAQRGRRYGFGCSAQFDGSCASTQRSAYCAHWLGPHCGIGDKRTIRAFVRG